MKRLMLLKSCLCDAYNTSECRQDSKQLLFKRLATDLMGVAVVVGHLGLKTRTLIHLRYLAESPQMEGDLETFCTTPRSTVAQNYAPSHIHFLKTFLQGYSFP